MRALCLPWRALAFRETRATARHTPTLLVRAGSPDPAPGPTAGLLLGRGLLTPPPARPQISSRSGRPAVGPGGTVRRPCPNRVCPNRVRETVPQQRSAPRQGTLQPGE